MPANVHVLDHPLIQHKVTLLRKKETSTTSFRRLLNEIGALMAYEVTRRHADARGDDPDAAGDDELQAHRRQEARVRADPARGHGAARRIPAGRAGCARGPHRALSRPQDAGRRRVLLQDAGRHVRTRRDRARPDARDRQLGGRGGRAPEGERSRVRSASCAWSRARRASAISGRRTRTCRSTRRRSIASSTTTGTSCRAWATPATGSSAPSDTRRGSAGSIDPQDGVNCE